MRDEDDLALRCLVRAAEAILVPTRENRAAALLWTARALLALAEADKHGSARRMAEEVVRDLRKGGDDHGREDEDPMD